MQSVWEKQLDPATGQQFFVNKVTLQSQWHEPSEIDSIVPGAYAPLQRWLEQIGVPAADAEAYTHALMDDGFDSPQALLTADISDLKDCGVKTGHAKLISKTIKVEIL